MRHTARELARLHAQAIAVVTVLEADDLVVELSVHVHMLLLSLVEALEQNDKQLVQELAECMPPAWLSKLPERSVAIAVAMRRAGLGRVGSAETGASFSGGAS